MARPALPAEKRRSEIRLTRLTPAEAEALADAADAQGTTVAALLRDGALRVLQPAA